MVSLQTVSVVTVAVSMSPNITHEHRQILSASEAVSGNGNRLKRIKTFYEQFCQTKTLGIDIKMTSLWQTINFLAN